VEFDWQPFELRAGGPEEGWALPAHIKARAKAAGNPLQARAQQLGITLVERDWIPSSRRAHECTEHARAEGKLEPFHAALLRAYWSEGRDIHDWDVLAAAAAEAALDAARMREAVESGAWKAAVDERVAAAAEMGIHAVPTFILDDRLIIQGAQTLDVFRGAMQRLGATPR
jgi:predicted DsbA family dithiol-disulfide isomerase